MFLMLEPERIHTVTPFYIDPSKSGKKKKNYRNLSLEIASVAIILGFVEVIQKLLFWWALSSVLVQSWNM